ncbi:MAG: Mu-like prophage major head subunit gpT family protein [Verrucomicrobia bacterium]|nr:Mu-like prophage major head subunit gpT family protein [Verrucomicrobiota bacterium]
MIISAAALASATKGFKKLYDGGLASAGEPRISKYAFRSPSMSADETYGWLGAMPGMKKLVGEANIRNLADHGFRVANEEFEVTVGVKRKDIERDRLGIYSGFFSAMGQNAGRHPDKLLAAALTGGFTSTCYTAKNFFDTDHEPQAGKTKFSNKGTKKISAANYRTARKTMLSLLDAEGEPISENPNLVLIVSPTYEGTAKEILLAERNANGATNIDRGSAALDVWPRLAGANEHMWFLVNIGGPVKPFVHQVEVDTEFASLTDPNSEHVLLQKEYLYQAYGRYNVAPLVPELVYGSTGADAA